MNMNNLFDILRNSNFIRTSLNLRSVVVINCVPGAGKTSLIRKLISENPSIEAYTAGIADTPNLSGNFIRKWEGKSDESKFTILDEYQLLDREPEGVDALFGDPLQSLSGFSLCAHWIQEKSQRIGQEGALLLRELGFQITSELKDKIVIEDLYKGEPEGQIICCEEDVEQLLIRHNANFLRLCEIIGRTFEVVTFVTSNRFDQGDRVKHFICLSRHKRKLLILCPEGTYN